MTDYMAPGGDNRIPRRTGYHVGRRLVSSRPELSPRETSIAALVATGESNEQIAFLLGLSRQTVKNALSKIYVKLSLRNRAELAIWMLQRGAVENVINRRLLDYVAR